MYNHIRLKEFSRHFIAISWNVAGIPQENIQDVVGEALLLSGFSVGFFQEFGPQESCLTCQVGSPNAGATLYVAPGISKYSRSNAIALSNELDTYFFVHEHCHYGNLVGIRVGKQIVAFLNLHVPHRKHTITLDQAWDDIDDMMARFRIVVSKLFGHVCSKSLDKIVWIWGADLNHDLRDDDSRSQEIKAHLSKHKLMYLQPEHEALVSHTQRSDGSQSLIDWVGCSSMHSQILKHHWADNVLKRIEIIDCILDSDHFPVQVIFDFASLFHFCECNAVKRRRLHLHAQRARKGWTLHGESLEQWQTELDASLEADHGKMSISVFNRTVLQHACKHPVNKQRNGNKYKDSDDIRDLINLRRQCGHDQVQVKRDLTKHINKLRRIDKATWQEHICNKVANRRWDFKADLEQHLGSKEHREIPHMLVNDVGESFGEDRASEWPKVVENFWGKVYKDNVATDEFVMSYMKLLCMQVTALTMCLRLENTWRPLFTMDILDKAIGGLKPMRCQDGSGMVSEVVQALGSKAKETMLALFEDRASDTCMDQWDDDPWNHLVAVLIAKTKGTCSVDQFRPIHVLYVLQKVYHRCLYIILAAFWKIVGFVQFGARKGHQAIELVHVLRVVVEKSIEWSRGYVIISLDIRKAFDSLSRAAILKFMEENPVPLRLKMAFLREILSKRTITMLFCDYLTDPVHMQSGLRQGGPDSSFLFALIINDILSKLCHEWKGKKLGYAFGPFGGEGLAFDEWLETFQEHIIGFDPCDIYVAVLAFMDDTYLVAQSWRHAQIMINDLVEAFLEAGLCLAPEKLKFMSENCDDEHAVGTLLVGGVPVQRVTELKVLGSLVCARGEERKTYEHRLKSAWACFWKWRHVLECSAPIGARLKFWMLTVGRSMLWGLSTTRADVYNAERLAITQRNMVRRMLRIKRRPVDTEPTLILEPWVEWQIRSLRHAANVITENNSSIIQHLVQERRSWAGHISRFGMGGKEQHLLKAVLLWRNVSWWYWQKFYNDCQFTVLRHKSDVGRLRRWEWFLPRDWILQEPSNWDPQEPLVSQLHKKRRI